MKHSFWQFVTLALWLSWPQIAMGYAYIDLGPMTSNAELGTVVVAGADPESNALKSLRKGISFTRDTVEVKYKERGTLLALVPVRLNLTAKAYASGKVEVRYPWYAVLTVDKKDELETKLKIAVDNALHERFVGSVRADGEPENPEFSDEERVEIAEVMHKVLQENLGNG